MDKSEDKLTKAKKKELDKRLQRYKEGKTVFHTREEIDTRLNLSN